VEGLAAFRSSRAEKLECIATRLLFENRAMQKMFEKLGFTLKQRGQ
jgi:hypothetical protein